jgi:subtilase family serine protease
MVNEVLENLSVSSMYKHFNLTLRFTSRKGDSTLSQCNNYHDIKYLIVEIYVYMPVCKTCLAMRNFGFSAKLTLLNVKLTKTNPGRNLQRLLSIES